MLLLSFKSAGILRISFSLAAADEFLDPEERVWRLPKIWFEMLQLWYIRSRFIDIHFMDWMFFFPLRWLASSCYVIDKTFLSAKKSGESWQRRETFGLIIGNKVGQFWRRTIVKVCRLSNFKNSHNFKRLLSNLSRTCAEMFDFLRRWAALPDFLHSFVLVINHRHEAQQKNSWKSRENLWK